MYSRDPFLIADTFFRPASPEVEEADAKRMRGATLDYTWSSEIIGTKTPTVECSRFVPASHWESYILSRVMHVGGTYESPCVLPTFHLARNRHSPPSGAGPFWRVPGTLWPPVMLVLSGTRSATIIIRVDNEIQYFRGNSLCEKRGLVVTVMRGAIRLHKFLVC